MLRNISFVALILSVIFPNRELFNACRLHLQRKHHSSFFKSSSYAQCLGHFEFKPCSCQAVRLARGRNFSVPDHPIGCLCGIGTSEFFGGGPRNFRILQIFKPPFKRLGSYESRCGAHQCGTKCYPT